MTKVQGHGDAARRSRCWLHRSLEALNESLHGKLWILKGDAARVIPAFAQNTA
jgi:deoxyribodipyrimidine photolyase